MRAHAVEVVAFTSADVNAITQQMQKLEESGKGSGWINIAPSPPGDHDQIDGPPKPTLLDKWFSGRGPTVPMATWTPPSTGRRPGPSTVGVEHGAGPNALVRLDDAGVPLPEGWRKLQDHAKHGIVAEPSPGAGYEEVLNWLLNACRHLCDINLKRPLGRGSAPPLREATSLGSPSRRTHRPRTACEKADIAKCSFKSAEAGYGLWVIMAQTSIPLRIPSPHPRQRTGGPL